MGVFAMAKLKDIDNKAEEKGKGKGKAAVAKA